VLTPLTDDDPRTIGSYRITNRIGKGGMGTVYLGYGADGKAAAVKVPSVGLAHDSEFRARFRQEVESARLVRGRRVAAVLDADAEADRPWMATEYVEGSSLSDAVHAQGRLEGPLLVGLAAGLAEALVAIHSAGVVHRDLKPSNILLSWDGPKVIDFGIARAMDATRHTRTGMIVGTMVWMAPEQLRGERAGTPADVFAWGACVAFAGTGRPPFRADRAEAIALKIVQEEPDLADLPAEVAALVRDALAKNPAARPTARDLVSRLGSATGTGSATAPGGTSIATTRLAGARESGGRGPTTGLEPLGPSAHGIRSGRPAPPPYAPRREREGGDRQGRRNPLPLLVAAAVLLLVVAAVIVAALVADQDGGRPPADVGTTPSATTAAETPGSRPEQTQPSSGRTTGEPTSSAPTEPAPTTYPSRQPSPTTSISPTPPATSSPTGAPTEPATTTTPPSTGQATPNQRPAAGGPYERE
jgi:serine/threonine protein kinase